ncbi:MULTISPECIES: hypothetical protein [unclassified Streptomyces]|uniref:hypothetical protein n=1 Tax=unclassified Streptomyces TaxID=2593676 RepID=UPI000B87C8EF|nr:MULTISPECIES: hypothetical protein [unclassified Streptomyces]MYS22031.1 hypothetical protein [Streptomyces sp. SID4948]
MRTAAGPEDRKTALEPRISLLVLFALSALAVRTHVSADQRCAARAFSATAGNGRGRAVAATARTVTTGHRVRPTHSRTTGPSLGA